MHNHRFVESELEVKKGKDEVKVFEDKNTKSGNGLLRHFCSNCVCIATLTHLLNAGRAIRIRVCNRWLTFPQGSPLYLQNPKAFPGLLILHEGSIAGDRAQATLEMFPENKYSWADKLIKERAKL
jgi:hypothetical protein